MPGATIRYLMPQKNLTYESQAGELPHPGLFSSYATSNALSTFFQWPVSPPFVDFLWAIGPAISRYIISHNQLLVE